MRVRGKYVYLVWDWNWSFVSLVILVFIALLVWGSIRNAQNVKGKNVKKYSFFFFVLRNVFCGHKFPSASLTWNLELNPNARLTWNKVGVHFWIPLDLNPLRKKNDIYSVLARITFGFIAFETYLFFTRGIR